MAELYVRNVSETSVDTINNKSIVSFDVYFDNWSMSYNHYTDHTPNGDGAYGEVYIDRQDEKGNWVRISHEDGWYGLREEFYAWENEQLMRSVSGMIIPHKSNGEQKIRFTGYLDTKVSLGSVPLKDGDDNAKIVTLTSIDRSAPTVSFTVGTVTTNSIQVSASANVNCDEWYYSINEGTTYTKVSGTGSSKMITISNLVPNQTVNIKVKARKASNQVFGFSNAQSVTTIGNTVINSVSDVIADATVVSVYFNVTVFDSSFTNTFRLKRGSTVLRSHLFSGWSSGDHAFSLESSERTTLLESFTDSKSTTYTLECETTKNGVQVGEISSIPIVVKTTNSSAPTFTSFSYNDINDETIAITEDESLFIQRMSTLYVSVSGATAKNGATITGYSISVGSKQISGSSSSISVGAIWEKGNVPLIVSVIDSRGYVYSETVILDVIEYKEIDIETVSLRRRNEVEMYTELSIQGRLSPIIISGDNKNSLQSIQYRFRKTNESAWGAWVEITDFTQTSGSFQYENDDWVQFDTDYSYDIQFRAYDKLIYETFEVVLVSGTPLLSLRKKKLGINNPDPAEELDVVGNVLISGWMKIGGRSFVDIIYPPGTIITLDYSISPEEIFGGHWEEIGSEHPHKWKRLSDIQINTSLKNEQVYATSYTFTASAHGGSGSYRIRPQYKLPGDEEYTYLLPGVNVSDYETVNITVSGGSERPISKLYRIEVKDFGTGEYQYSQAYQIDWRNTSDDFYGLDYVEIPISADKYAFITLPEIDLNEDDVIYASIEPYGYSEDDERTGQYILQHSLTASNMVINRSASAYSWGFRYAKNSVPENGKPAAMNVRTNLSMTINSSGDTKGTIMLFAYSAIATRAFYGKVYLISISRNGELLLQLVPKMRASDNVPGLYDTVSGLFYPSTGTQAFLPS